jgi:hypothetical protein
MSNLFNIPIASQAAPEIHDVQQPIYNNTDVKSLINLFDEVQIEQIVQNPEQVAPAVKQVAAPPALPNFKEAAPIHAPPALMSLFSNKIEPVPAAVVKEEPAAAVVVKEEPAAAVVVKEEPAAVVKQEPAVVVKQEPAAVVVVKEEPAVVVKQEPDVVVKQEPAAPVHRLSSLLNPPIQKLSSILLNSAPSVKSVSDTKNDAVNTIKIQRIKDDEPKINEPEIPIRVLKIDVPKQKPVVHVAEPEPTKITIVKMEADKPVIEKQQEIKVIKVQIPKIENKESVKAIEPLPQKQQPQQPNPEVQNKLNQLELQNKLLAQKLAETTAAYAHACQQNKNLAIALSMRR